MKRKSFAFNSDRPGAGGEMQRDLFETAMKTVDVTFQVCVRGGGWTFHLHWCVWRGNGWRSGTCWLHLCVVGESRATKLPLHTSVTSLAAQVPTFET